MLLDYSVVIAESPEAVLDNYRLRQEGFHELEAFRAGPSAPGYDLDERDGIPPLRTLFNVVHRGCPIGAARVCWPDATMARRDKSHTGLPMGRAYVDACLAGRRVVELSRVVVRREHRGSSAAPALVEGILDWCRAQRIELIVGLVPCETDHAPDAALMMQSLDARGLLLWDSWLADKPGDEHGRGVAPLYTPAQRRLAMAGRAGELPLPRTVQMCVDFGGRFAGQARFDPTLGVMSAPMIAPVPERPLHGVPPSLGSAA